MVRGIQYTPETVLSKHSDTRITDYAGGRTQPREYFEFFRAVWIQASGKLEKQRAVFLMVKTP